MTAVWRSLTSIEVLVCLLLIVVADGFLLLTDTRWVGEWGWTPEWANGGLFLASALVAGVASHLAVPYFRPGFRESLGAQSTRASAFAVGAAWLRGTTVGAAGHVVVVIAALAATAVTRPTDALFATAFVYPLLPLVMSSSLGVAIVAFAPSRMAAALVIGLSYVIAYQAATGAIALPYIVGGQTVSMVGLRYSSTSLGVLSGAGGWAAAILLMGAAAAVRMKGFAMSAAVTVAAVFAATVVPSVVIGYLPDRFEVSSRHIGFVCDGHAPRVCLANGHTRHLSTIVLGVGRAARSLQEAGVNLDGVVLREELPYPLKDGSGVLLLPESYLNQARFTSADYAKALTRPRDCDAYDGFDDTKQGDDLLAVADALAAWIQRPPTGDASTRQVSGSWARAAYNSLATCRVPAGLLDGHRG